MALLLAVLGVVYGDIGTSPFYALATVFSIDRGAIRPTSGDVTCCLMPDWAIVSLIWRAHCSSPSSTSSPRLACSARPTMRGHDPVQACSGPGPKPGHRLVSYGPAAL